MYITVQQDCVQLKDETKANDEAVKAIDGVLSIVKGGGQYQIVIGQHVADVYNELQTMMGQQKMKSN